jgi:uncharacterized protein
MTLAPFPDRSRMRWRRLDVPGREAATVVRSPGGWRLRGAIRVEEDGVAASLRYRIDCDAAWRTRGARVAGRADGRAVGWALTSDGAGTWFAGGVTRPELAGAFDIDLGFTPATNMLPIRRLALAVGASARVRTAWLRFPELRLEPLEQRYTRLAERVYAYEADVDGTLFSARLDVDACGRVLLYEGLWAVEAARP